jgi:DNA replication protein DnaC
MANENCPHCRGTGWVSKDRDGISAAERCACVDQAQEQEKEERAQIPRNYRNASFDIKAPDNEVLKKAIVAVKGYALNYTPRESRPGLLLAGPTGTAKTHLAIAAMRMLMNRGFEGVFFDYQNLLQRIYAGYSESLRTSNREAYQTALETDVLVLDDLGSQNTNEWVEDTVTSIITYRYNHQKPLIATTNLPDPDYGGVDHAGRLTLHDRIGARARSRLFEMCTVVPTWGAGDFRMESKKVLR